MSLAFPPCFFTLLHEQFKAIMNGGTAAPLMDSPYRVELRKVAFWKGATYMFVQLLIPLSPCVTISGVHHSCASHYQRIS